MNDRPEWFAPKRYGFGAGLPISWQGWALLLGFIAAASAISLALAKSPVQLIAVMIPLTTVFIAICAWTTKGGWRWRWGQED